MIKLGKKQWVMYRNLLILHYFLNSQNLRPIVDKVKTWHLPRPNTLITTSPKKPYISYINGRGGFTFWNKGFLTLRLTRMLEIDKTLWNQNHITTEIHKIDLFCHIFMLHFNYVFASDNICCKLSSIVRKALE